ncbi:MAG TPA: NF038129 family PEP-CTERM protein [Paludibaculum sp.]|jgi:hypothetical protein
MKKLLLATLMFAAFAAAAPIQFTINTSALNGEAGTIDIQFNPGAFPAVYDPGTATITNFLITGGTLGPISAGPDGGVAGALPGPLVLTNLDFLNGLVHDATFGSQVSFLVDFAGLAYTAPSPSILSSFSVTLSSNSGAITALADLIGDSKLDTSGSSPEVSSVPEPGTWSMLALGLGALGFAARRRRIQ